ncbi:MAG: site-specific integrase, partial [Muribaculaceae bacterium]|nr:site-specific integrase [Muribaculaceae bacterium]
IDLNNYSSAILSKYIDTDGEKVFPQLRLYSMKSRLRKIGEICGIDTPVNISEMIGSRRISRTAPKYQLLTSHCGRRTFICNALSLGIPPNIVMKWTGHSDYKAMQPYIDIADNARIESMALFDKLQKTN